MHTDGLGCFRGFAAAGCEHAPQVTGGGPESCRRPALGRVNTALGDLKRSLDGTYHRLGPKYSARSLPRVQDRFNRRYNLAVIPERLLHAAPATLPVPRRVLELYAYAV